MIWAQRCRAALVGALAATCVTLVPDAALADPTNEEPTEGMLEPDYAAGLKAIEAKNDSQRPGRDD